MDQTNTKELLQLTEEVITIAARLADALAKINPDHPAVADYDRLRNRYTD